MYNMRKIWLMLATILFVVSCSSKDSNDTPQQESSNSDEDRQVESEESNKNKDEEIKSDREEPPESITFTSKLPKSYVTTSAMEVSEEEKEVINTLNEFHAEEIDDSTKLTLPEDILFNFDSDELREDADQAIEKLVKVLDASDGDVEIVGHTDSKGEDDYNQGLSVERAESVLDALADSGIEESRMDTVGEGADRPVAQNTNSDGSDNPEGREKNRRVEVTIHNYIP